MMQTRYRPAWILALLLLTSFALVACVRPYPGGDQVEAQPVPDIVATAPLFVPVPTIAAPLDNTSTLEPVPVDPGVEQPEPTVEAPAAVDTVHTVLAGDTLFKIALQYDVSIEEITAVNDIPDINRLEIGQQIVIPAPGSVSIPETPEETGAAEGETVSEATPQPEEAASPEAPAQAGGVHVVQAGENLFRIGLQYGCSVSQMSAANGIANPTYIYVGQELTVPNCN